VSEYVYDTIKMRWYVSESCLYNIIKMRWYVFECALYDNIKIKVGMWLNALIMMLLK